MTFLFLPKSRSIKNKEKDFTKGWKLLFLKTHSFAKIKEIIYSYAITRYRGK